MTSPFHSEARPLAALCATAALGIFYWALFRMPLPGAHPAEMDREESRRLEEDSAVLVRFGKWDRALKLTLKLHAAWPENPIYLARLGEIYHRLGRYREESAAWEEFLDRSPRPIEGCPQAGQSYEKQGMEQRAIATFERCLAFQPGNPDSIFYLAHALERNGEEERSAALYEHGAALYPAYADLETGLARIRLRQGRAKEARQLAGAVIEQHPENVDALLVVGLACRQLGDRAAALDYLRRGVQLADGYADLHVVLGGMAEEDGDLEGAILHYQKAAALDRSNAGIAQRLALLRRARE